MSPRSGDAGRHARLSRGSGLLPGYGTVEIDRLALAYYRYERVLQDFGENAECVYWLPDQSEALDATRRSGITSMFDPGKQASEAIREDARASKRS